jgi:hypothetical protein
MPGLVPGIHAVKRRVDIRTSTDLSAPDGAIDLDLLYTSRVDGRDEPGHDGTLSFSRPILASLSLS